MSIYTLVEQLLQTTGILEINLYYLGNLDYPVSQLSKHAQAHQSAWLMTFWGSLIEGLGCCKYENWLTCVLV